MATSSLEVWDDKPNHSACRVRGYRTPPSQDQRRDPNPGPAATRQPGPAADPLRQHRLPLPRRPAAAPRALPDLDPQGRQQDRHPHPGHHPSRRPAPADGELPATTRTHHRTRDPRAPAGQKRPDPARPLTGISARALRYSWLLAGRGFRGSGDAGPQHLVVTRFQEYQDGNPLSEKSGPASFLSGEPDTATRVAAAHILTIPSQPRAARRPSVHLQWRRVRKRRR